MCLEQGPEACQSVCVIGSRQQCAQLAVFVHQLRRRIRVAFAQNRQQCFFLFVKMPLQFSSQGANLGCQIRQAGVGARCSPEAFGELQCGVMLTRQIDQAVVTLHGRLLQKG